MKKIYPISLITLCALLTPLASIGEDNSTNKSPIKLFLQVCAATYAHASQVDKAAIDIGLNEITGNEAKQYLMNNPGKVWKGLDNSLPYAVTLMPNGLCTVLVYKGDAEDIQKSVDWWLPPEATGIVVKKEEIPSPLNLTTTAYELRGGKVNERWVITISSDPNSQLRAMLSWNKL